MFTHNEKRYLYSGSLHIQPGSKAPYLRQLHLRYRPMNSGYYEETGAMTPKIWTPKIGP